jgi:hypothetical protein
MRDGIVLPIERQNKGEGEQKTEGEGRRANTYKYKKREGGRESEVEIGGHIEMSAPNRTYQI